MRPASRSDPAPPHRPFSDSFPAPVRLHVPRRRLARVPLLCRIIPCSAPLRFALLVSPPLRPANSAGLPAPQARPAPSTGLDSYNSHSPMTLLYTLESLLASYSLPVT